MQKMELSYWWKQGDEKNKNKLGEWRAFADTVGITSEHRASLRPSLQLSSFESRKTLEQLFIFQIGTLNPRGINECSSFN